MLVSLWPLAHFPAAAGAALLSKIQALSQAELCADKAKRRQRSEGAAAFAPSGLECKAELAVLSVSPREPRGWKEEESGKAGYSL